VFGLPTVDIVGSGASLNNEGGINGLNFMGGGVAVRGPAIGVSIDNSGTISNFGGGIAISTGADLSGGLLNQASGAISGRTFGIAVGVFGSSDISGLLDNSGTLTGGSGVGVLSSSNILGGVANRTGGTILGRGTGVFTFDHSDIQGGISNEAMATIQGLTFGILSAMTSDISGGIDNSGGVFGGAFGIFVDPSDISGGVVNQVGGTIAGGSVGILVDPASQISGGIANGGIIEGMSGAAILDGDRVLMVTNAGLLKGGGGVALDFRGDDDSLTLQTGSNLVGLADGGAGMDAIRLEGVGSENEDFIDFETLEMAGTDWALSGRVTLLTTGGVDFLEVTGDVTVDPAAVLEVVFAPGAPDVQNTTVVMATGTVDANFQNLTVTNGQAISALIGDDKIVLNPPLLSAVRPGAVSTAAQASVEEGFAVQRAVIGEQRVHLVGPDSRLWARGLADFIERDGDGLNAGYRQDITGTVFGGDTGSLGVEGLRLGLQGGHQSQEVERAVIVGGMRTVGRGDTTGYLLGGYLGASQDFAIDDNWLVRPSSSLRYQHQAQDGYRDSEGLAVDALSLDTLRLGPQVELLGHYVDTDGVIFRPRGQVGWTQQIALDDRQVRLSLPSGLSGEVDLEDGNESYLTVGFGLDVIFQPGLRAYVGFDGAYDDAQSRSSVFAGVSIDLS
jgi:hypothetical protein